MFKKGYKMLTKTFSTAEKRVIIAISGYVFNIFNIVLNIIYYSLFNTMRYQNSLSS